MRPLIPWEDTFISPMRRECVNKIADPAAPVLRPPTAPPPYSAPAARA